MALSFGEGCLGCEECEIPEKAFLMDQISCKWLKVCLRSVMRRSSKYLWELLDEFGFGEMRWFTKGFFSHPNTIVRQTLMAVRNYHTISVATVQRDVNNGKLLLRGGSR